MLAYPDDIMQKARAVAQTLLGELSRFMALEAIAEAILAERKRCAAIARHKATHACDHCECLGGTDPETGIQECSLETRGGDCLCQVSAEMANEIANGIEGI